MIDNDTIAAISTPSGRGGIAVIRVAGPEAIEIVGKIWRGKNLCHCASHTAHLGNIVDPVSDDILDQAVATIFKGPASYTGDDTIELSVHGSKYVQSRLLKLLIDNGCRLAEAGEFTRRAFTSGRLDLAEAEAVADLIAASSRSSHRIALNQMRGKLSDTLAQLRERLLHLASLIELELDFAEEDVEFASRKEIIDASSIILGILNKLTASFSTAKAIKEGIPMAIVGAPNAGKSTLLNSLAEDERAIVSPIPGTTRDTVEDSIEIKGTTFRLIDTAGIRHNTDDSIEKIGMDRTKAAIAKAEIVVWVVDPADIGTNVEIYDEIVSHLLPDSTLIIAINKIDLYPGPHSDLIGQLTRNGIVDRVTKICQINANNHATLNDLIDTVASRIDSNYIEDAMLTNSRHYQAALRATESISSVISSLSDEHNILPLDLIAIDLRNAIHHLGEITGTITTPDILASIFSRFCIGK